MKSAVLIVVGFIKKVEDTEGSSEFLFATALLHYCPKMVTKQPGSILMGSRSAFSPRLLQCL